MKKTIFTLVVAMFIAAAVFASCKPPAKEEKEASEKVQQANEELVEAQKAATAEEWQAFKKSGDSIIKKNEERIAELKLEMKKTGKSIDAKYEKSIAALEQKNEHLKVEIKTYKNDANADWQSFKREFEHDTYELGQALKDVMVDNKK